MAEGHRCIDKVSDKKLELARKRQKIDKNFPTPDKSSQPARISDEDEAISRLLRGLRRLCEIQDDEERKQNKKKSDHIIIPINNTDQIESKKNTLLLAHIIDIMKAVLTTLIVEFVMFFINKVFK